MRRIVITLMLSAGFAAAALAHHGWGSYDASKAITVEGAVQTSKYENPHVLITVKATDKVWTVVLAPTSRMMTRGALQAMVAVGKTVTAVGYASTAQTDEMRAERITVEGKTVELR